MLATPQTSEFQPTPPAQHTNAGQLQQNQQPQQSQQSLLTLSHSYEEIACQTPTPRINEQLKFEGIHPLTKPQKPQDHTNYKLAMTTTIHSQMTSSLTGGTSNVVRSSQNSTAGWKSEQQSHQALTNSTFNKPLTGFLEPLYRSIKEAKDRVIQEVNNFFNALETKSLRMVTQQLLRDKAVLFDPSRSALIEEILQGLSKQESCIKSLCEALSCLRASSSSEDSDSQYITLFQQQQQQQQQQRSSSPINITKTTTPNSQNQNQNLSKNSQSNTSSNSSNSSSGLTGSNTNIPTSVNSTATGTTTSTPNSIIPVKRQPNLIESVINSIEIRVDMSKLSSLTQFLDQIARVQPIERMSPKKQVTFEPSAFERTDTIRQSSSTSPPPIIAHHSYSQKQLPQQSPSQQIPKRTGGAPGSGASPFVKIEEISFHDRLSTLKPALKQPAQTTIDTAGSPTQTTTHRQQVISNQVLDQLKQESLTADSNNPMSSSNQTPLSQSQQQQQQQQQSQQQNQQMRVISISPYPQRPSSSTSSTQQILTSSQVFAQINPSSPQDNLNRQRPITPSKKMQSPSKQKVQQQLQQQGSPSSQSSATAATTSTTAFKAVRDTTPNPKTPAERRNVTPIQSNSTISSTLNSRRSPSPSPAQTATTEIFISTTPIHTTTIVPTTTTAATTASHTKSSTTTQPIPTHRSNVNAPASTTLNSMPSYAAAAAQKKTHQLRVSSPQTKETTTTGIKYNHEKATITISSNASLARLNESNSSPTTNKSSSTQLKCHPPVTAHFKTSNLRASTPIIKSSAGSTSTTSINPNNTSIAAARPSSPSPSQQAGRAFPGKQYSYFNLAPKPNSSLLIDKTINDSSVFSPILSTQSQSPAQGSKSHNRDKINALLNSSTKMPTQQPAKFF